MKKIYITEDDMCTTQKLNLARVQKWFISNECEMVDNPEVADHILCMTCNGWSLLEDISYQRIRKFSDQYPQKTIVMGCVVDAHPENVKKMWSGPVVGTKSQETYSFSGIEKLFPDFNKSISSVPAQSIFRRKEDYRDYNPSKRFINISEGCAFACSFCTHKPGLGNRRSRPLAEILEQLDGCVKDGVRVVNLMGMETSLWGIEHGTNFAELLKEVLSLSDTYEVHVAQFNASGIDRYFEALLPSFQNKRVTDFQAPIQSMSPRILKMMNRKFHGYKVGDFMSAVRALNSRIILRTDLIVGWPTETPEERYESLDFAGAYFDEVALYTIELSPDLPAWKYQDQAFSPEELKKIRIDAIGYLESKFPNLVIHSGQQDDNTMKTVEIKRIKLRQLRESIE